MILHLETPTAAHEPGLDIGPFVEEFIRTTVVFSLWYGEPRVERVHVLLEPAVPTPGSTHVRCTLKAALLGGQPVTAGATGSDVCEAVQEAANLLEVALHRPAPPHPAVVPSIAARRRAPGLHSGTPARATAHKAPIPVASAAGS